jgi:hypothetical protein
LPDSSNNSDQRELPKIVGVSSENMAHRIAIRYPTDEGMKPGVFIWRRETDQKLVQMLGGRAFPGVHGAAQFYVSENAGQLTMEVRTEGGQTVGPAFRARIKSVIVCFRSLGPLLMN